MSGAVPAVPRFKFTDAAGNPLALGWLTVYEAGTTTLANTWSDSDLTSNNTNPIHLDANGECLVWLDPSKRYKFLLQDSALATVQGWPVDNIPGNGASATRGNVSLDDYLTGAQRTAMRTNVWTGVNITTFTAAVQAAIDAAATKTLEISTPAYIKINRPLVWNANTAIVGLGVPGLAVGVTFFPDLSVDWSSLYPNKGVLTTLNYLVGDASYPSATAGFWTGIGKQFQVRADIDSSNYASFRSRVPDYGIVIWCPNESVLMEHVQVQSFKKADWMCGGVQAVPTFLHCNGMSAGAGQDTSFGDTVTRPASPFGAAVTVYSDVSADTSLFMEAATSTDLDTLAISDVLTINGATYTVATVPAVTASVSERTVTGGVATTTRFVRRVTLTGNITANGRIYPSGIAFRNHPDLNFAPGVAAASGGRGNSGSARLIGFSGDNNADLVFCNGSHNLSVISPKSEANNSMIHISGSSFGGSRAHVEVIGYRADGFGTFDGGVIRITGRSRPSVVAGTGQIVGYTYILNDQTSTTTAEQITTASLYGQGGLHYCRDGSEVASFTDVRISTLTVGDLASTAPTITIKDGSDPTNRKASLECSSATDIYRFRVGPTPSSVWTIGANTGNNFYLWAYNGTATEKFIQMFNSGGVAACLIGQNATQKVGFFGATPVVRQTLSAAATDAATTQTLANSLRTALINLGLAA